MFCANCGKEIKEGMNFCSSCGAKIEPNNKEEFMNDNINNTENNVNIDIKEEQKDNNTTNNSIYSTSDFYMDIKGIKSRFDHGYNNMQFFAFFSPIIIHSIFYIFKLMTKNSYDDGIPSLSSGVLFWIILPIITFIIANKINPRGVFINMQNGVLIKNKKSKFGFLRDELHLKEVFVVRVKSFNIDAIPAPKGKWYNSLFGSGEFYKFTFFDKNGSPLLNIHLTNKNDRDKLIEALKTVFNILGKYDVQIEVNNSVSRDFDELAM